MKKWLLLALPLFIIWFTFAQTWTSSTWDISTWSTNTWIVNSGNTTTGSIKCYKEIWADIVSEYRAKRVDIMTEKTLIKNQIRYLLAEKKTIKDRTIKSEISKEIKLLEWEIWSLNTQSALSYKSEYKEKINAKKNEAEECRIKKSNK